MTDLWFEGDFGRLSRRGTMLYVARPDGIRAVLRMERTHPDDLAQEEAELILLYGGSTFGISSGLLDDGVRLPPTLRKWAEGPDIPMEQLGGWTPTLLSRDGKADLALARNFGKHRMCATTLADDQITVLAPKSDFPIRLATRDDLDAPPPGWESHQF